MTLPRSETPLRRSAVGSHHQSMLRELTTRVNDDEAERREARRRTLLQNQTRPRDSSVLESIEENETIRNCLEIYNGNKLSRDNAWSLSLIDTLSSLLERHHKTLSNFKMAGSSLEASSKVYGLRVDSIYVDAMRMSAGLNARTLTEQQLNAASDRDDSVADNAECITSVVEPSAGVSLKPKKRARKPVSTVTKNKDTLNARLDTAPLQDPIFGKLNSTVGSINASNRLMHNILPTDDSELRLRTNYLFWNAEKQLSKLQDYTLKVPYFKSFDTQSLVNAEWAKKLRHSNKQLKLRPLHSGYIITDAPNPSNANEPVAQQLEKNKDTCVVNAYEFYDNPKELSMAFDINADCEPMPELDAPAETVLEVDYKELDELTAEERTTLQHCRALRKKPTIIDDLRPVDGSSHLEYSYRPMDQICQFWAGPSHWKFKRSRARSTFGKSNPQENIAAVGSLTNSTTTTAARARRAALQAAKRRSKQLNFGECTESLFQTLDTNTKLRKANYQKRWDARKLMLPTKFEFEHNYFFKYDYAPSINVSRRFGVQDDDDDDMDIDNNVADDGPDDVELFDNDNFDADTAHMCGAMEASSMPLGCDKSDNFVDCDPASYVNLSQVNATLRHSCNDTVLEIATDFEGAPTQVTKVIVPFAKRAKVIDMRNLKRSCNCLIQKQLLNAVEEENIPEHSKGKEEHYAKGMANFKEIYEKLPGILTTKMAESLSPSVALYAVLHLANDMKLRLIPQDDLDNIIIRQVSE